MKIFVLLMLSMSLLSACSSGGNKYADKEPQDLKVARINVELARNYILKKDYIQADEKLKRALRAYPDLAEAHSTMAYLQELLNQPELADQYYQEAIDLGADDASIQNNYARFLCTNDHFEEAQKHFQIAVDDPLYQYRVQSMVNSGVCYLKENKSIEAEDRFRQALKSNPKYLPALLEMAEMTAKEGRWIQTRAFVSKYNSIRSEYAAGNDKVNPYHPKALWLCVQAGFNTGNDTEAAKCAIRLKNQFPESRETTLLLQSSYYRRR